MKQYAIALFLLTFCATAKATFCVDRIYQEEKINLYICQNHSCFNETRSLLYKARTKVLNDYIKDKIAKEELQDKKFEIQIFDAVLTSPDLRLTQGKNGYFVTLTGFPSLQDLMTIVDYFSKPNWKPILFGDDFYTVGGETIKRRIDSFYKQNTIEKIFPYQPFSVWKKDEVSLEYSGDSLKYLFNDSSLSFSTSSSLPIKISDRFLFFQADSIFVVHNMQTLASIEIDKLWKDTSEDFDIYVFPKWVNICDGGKDNWIYSYSYDKNKFYKRNK
jgi:hypothetical protein